jgi:hypothetical protein
MEEIGHKVKKSERVITTMLTKYNNPCVFWSGGKDSMVLLHMIKFLIGKDLPVICFKEPWFPWKLDFSNRIIKEWNLTAWDWAPSKVELCRGKNRIDVMNSYQINRITLQEPQFIMLARGTESPEEGLPYLCAIETFLARPLGYFNFTWDVAFHGHKSIDEDPLSGKLPLQVDFLQNANAVDTVFPLREWTDEDIFEYHEKFDVPFDENRYDVKKRTVAKNNKLNNPDYYHTCFKCCDPMNSSYVRCPKYDVDMNNISGSISWVEPKMDYCGLRKEK